MQAAVRASAGPNPSATNKWWASQENPLTGIHQIIQEAKQNQLTRYPGPIDRLLKLFSLSNKKIKTIWPSITLNRESNRFKTIIDKTREDSIKNESTDDADFKIFSDGSGHDNGIGSAAILYEKGRTCSIKTLQAYLGTPDKHNTYEAEIIGALLALWILNNTPEIVGKRVTHYIDNQSVITALHAPKATPRQHLLNVLQTAANRIGCTLTIRWISSHSKVKGNEDVDKLAKNAAEGRSSTSVHLPHLLRNLLPTSTSAIKQEFHTSLKTRWAVQWEASPRKARITQLGGSFPFSTFLKSLELLTRKQSSMIMQIRCGHFPLNVYLHRINKVNMDKC